jgi:hypothetical protein
MPCYDGREHEEEARVRSELSDRTRMLCAVLTLFEGHDRPFDLPDDVEQWWQEHKEFDRKRAQVKV